MHRILVSACLLGHAVRYNGQHKESDDALLRRWVDEGRVVAVCPEVAGGLPVPRPPAEIAGGVGGALVLAGHARVIARSGQDVTSEFVCGAEHALALAHEHGIRVAVLTEGSPSCSGHTYDGSFTGTRVTAPGVTAALLKQHGVRVFSEAQWAEADVAIRALEAAATD
jgi:uncharacterized protein YbbK (DUF523 family)